MPPRPRAALRHPATAALRSMRAGPGTAHGPRRCRPACRPMPRRSEQPPRPTARALMPRPRAPRAAIRASRSAPRCASSARAPHARPTSSSGALRACSPPRRTRARFWPAPRARRSETATPCRGLPRCRSAAHTRFNCAGPSATGSTVIDNSSTSRSAGIGIERAAQFAQRGGLRRARGGARGEHEAHHHRPRRRQARRPAATPGRPGLAAPRRAPCGGVHCACARTPSGNSASNAARRMHLSYTAAPQQC